MNTTKEQIQKARSMYENGATYQQIKDECGFSSRSLAHHHVKNIPKREKIERVQAKCEDLEKYIETLHVQAVDLTARLMDTGSLQRAFEARCDRYEKALMSILFYCNCFEQRGMEIPKGIDYVIAKTKEALEGAINDQIK